MSYVVFCSSLNQQEEGQEQEQAVEEGAGWRRRGQAVGARGCRIEVDGGVSSRQEEQGAARSRQEQGASSS